MLCVNYMAKTWGKSRMTNINSNTSTIPLHMNELIWWKANYMQSVGETVLVQRCKYIKIKLTKKHISCKQQPQEGRSFSTNSRTNKIKNKNIIRDKHGHFRIRVSTHQEEV